MKRIHIQATIEVDVPDDAIIKGDFIVTQGKTLTPSVVISEMHPVHDAEASDWEGDVNWSEFYNEEHGVPLRAVDIEDVELSILEVPCIPPVPLPE